MKRRTFWHFNLFTYSDRSRWALLYRRGFGRTHSFIYERRG